MSRWRLMAWAAICACLAGVRPVAASERYAVVVTGASGGAPYAARYDAWRNAFVQTLRQTFNYPGDHILVLAEKEAPGVLVASRDNVRRAVADLRGRLTKDDVLLVLLIGHGTGGDGPDAKFNLVGPDLTAAEWGALLRPMPGRLVFVNTASGSFPFLQQLAGRDRVVLTANDSAAQQFETVFPEHFVKAFTEEGADLDKNNKVSIGEAFSYASERVRNWFVERNQLATERALLDDSGDGAGREANAVGPDGTLAQVTYLQPEVAVAETGDQELTALLRRRAEVELELEALKARKSALPSEDYDAALEKLLLELAQIDRRVRTKS